MTLPDDPNGRSWIELANTNPNEVNRIRSALIAFVAFNRGREPSFAGTGFVIAGDSEMAVVISAKHVLEEGVTRIQRPESVVAATNLYVLSRLTRPSLDKASLKASWMGSSHSLMLDALHVEYTDALDLALCLLVRQENEISPFLPASIPVDVTIPKEGDIVHLVSFDQMRVDEHAAPQDASGSGQVISVHRRVRIRRALVTGVYQKGLRQYRWPCFTTSAPMEPGMSGGFVYMPRDGQTIGACGIICADNSPQDSFHDEMVPGESIIASSWPSMCLRVPTHLPASPQTPLRSLFELANSGDIDRPLGNFHNLYLVDRGEDVQEIGIRR
jgi:hypothetical protein